MPLILALFAYAPWGRRINYFGVASVIGLGGLLSSESP